MAILDFQKPEEVIMLETSEKRGVFEFRPLEPGYGITVGNALRRVLIGSLEGFAITSIKISGVDHEFATIPGVIDDVTNIILNLKEVRFKRNAESEAEEETITLRVSNASKLLAGEFNSALVNFTVLNPDHVVCEMDETASFEITLHIGKGRGYVPADENRGVNDPIGLIAIDAIYTPITNVKYSIEPFRVEQRTDFEKLVIEIDTDGSIHPKEALKEAAKILIFHFMLFSDEKIILETPETNVIDTLDEELLRMRQLLNSKLADMSLSVRALNCLKAAEVETLGQLVTFHRSDLLKFRNFGKKSLTELDELLDKHNLQFGMDITKYKLDKD